MSAEGARRLESGRRSRVWRLDAPDGERLVVKLAATDAIDRELAALARVSDLRMSPVVVAAGPGVLVTRALPGLVRPPDAWRAGDAGALGGTLARLHSREGGAVAAYPGWDRPAGSRAEYRHRRAAQVDPLRGAGASDAGPPPAGDDDPAFVLVHGDLWSGNIVWTAGGPALVDWEYLRLGDPAEEIAYLAAMDDLTDTVLDALLHGYGAPALRAAVDWWRPLLCRECADWFATEQEPERAARLLGQAERLACG
jgi:aminoglycoside phosphotransferase (APT) family kinase protein